ncbi:hypothetical protein [Bacillus sp. V59.32b]|uniref:hypothetical protein n=1 Tax=Bacillus sp. V59.32b TaxID=1758642 RepID=UPI001058A412|nr:hypothetical protein [Bacillus sp. V59.32b]
MRTNQGRSGIARKFKIWGTAFAIGLSLVAATPASAEKNEHKIRHLNLGLSSMYNTVIVMTRYTLLP